MGYVELLALFLKEYATKNEASQQVSLGSVNNYNHSENSVRIRQFPELKSLLLQEGTKYGNTL